MRPTPEYYRRIQEELASLGIYLDSRDIFALVKIVLGSLFDTVKSTESKVYIGGNKDIVVSPYIRGIKVIFNKGYRNTKKIIRMTDATSIRVFDHMFSEVFDKFK